MDCSLPGSSVQGIPQAGILEGAAIPSPGDLPDSGIEPRSPALQVDSLLSEPPGKPTGVHKFIQNICLQEKDVRLGMIFYLSGAYNFMV